MRKDIFERIKIMKKQDIEINYAEVARTYNCDYRTVKRYYERDDSDRCERRAHPSKLDGFKSIIAEKVKDGCTAAAIYRFVKKKGYCGKYTILNEYCKTVKTAERRKATIRFETNPGLQGQVDWKEKFTLTAADGMDYTINVFLMVLGYSRTKYIELTLDRNQDTLLSAMVNAFKFFGGVPKEILFDNMRTVVNQSRTQYNEAVINDTFYHFSKDFGFQIITCRAYRPQTKGKVEALAKLMQRLRPYNHEFTTIEELEQIVSELRNDINTEASDATGSPPFKLLTKEKEYLLPMPADEILRSYLTKPIVRKVSKESMITYKSRKYSLDPDYIGKDVEIKEANSTIYIYADGQEVACHKLSENHFNYREEDIAKILASDAFKGMPEDYVETFARNNLNLYDNL